VPKRLGSFPFWRGETRFLEAMESIYMKASAIGLRVFLVEQVNPVRKVGALTPPSIMNELFLLHPRHKWRGFLTG
jgi:hypothetical protein